MVDGDFEGLQRICLSSCMITDHMANRQASCSYNDPKLQALGHLLVAVIKSRKCPYRTQA